MFGAWRPSPPPVSGYQALAMLSMLFSSFEVAFFKGIVCQPTGILLCYQPLSRLGVRSSFSESARSEIEFLRVVNVNGGSSPNSRRRFWEDMHQLSGSAGFRKVNKGHKQW